MFKETLISKAQWHYQRFLYNNSYLFPKACLWFQCAWWVNKFFCITPSIQCMRFKLLSPPPPHTHTYHGLVCALKCQAYWWHSSRHCRLLLHAQKVYHRIKANDCSVYAVVIGILPVLAFAVDLYWFRALCSGGRFNNTYELLNLRALKFWYVNKIHIFQCMGKIFCVEFQRYPLKFYTKYLTHTLKDMIFMQFLKF